MVNFCAALGGSNHSNRERGKGHYRIPATVPRSRPKKQAPSVERRATWLARSRIRREDVAADATEFHRARGDHPTSDTQPGARHSLQSMLFDLNVPQCSVTNIYYIYYMRCFCRLFTIKPTQTVHQIILNTCMMNSEFNIRRRSYILISSGSERD